jgi:hypothetical protein
MKNLSIKLNDPSEVIILTKAIQLASGQKVNIKPAAFVFVSEDFKVKSSNDEKVYAKRIEHEISVFDAVVYLDSITEKKPFLNRSGLKVPIAGKIDSFIKDQFSSYCKSSGYKPDDRLENLIAADIKCKIHGLDLVEVVKEELQNGK